MCLLEEHEGQNGQLGTFLSPRRTVDSVASHSESEVLRYIPGEVEDEDGGHGRTQVKSEA